MRNRCAENISEFCILPKGVGPCALRIASGWSLRISPVNRVWTTETQAVMTRWTLDCCHTRFSGFCASWASKSLWASDRSETYLQTIAPQMARATGWHVLEARPSNWIGRARCDLRAGNLRPCNALKENVFTYLTRVVASRCLSW
jgi:hypothetical protein